MTATAVLPRPRRSPENQVLPAARSLGSAPGTVVPVSRAEGSQRVLHQLVRREFRMLAETSAWACPEDGAHTIALTRHDELIGRVLLHHHGVERERLWPALRRSLPEPEVAGFEATLSAWTASCARIDHMLRDVATSGRQWAVARTRPARDAFATACRALADAVDRQTAEEERTLLPLVSTHLDPEEWAAITRTACAGLSRRERLFVLGAALEDACADDRERVLAGLPARTRTSWRIVGHGRYRAAVVRLRGEPPAV